MIRNIAEKLKEDRRDACAALEAALATNRGTREARIEAAAKRDNAIQTKTCSCCGQPDGRHIGTDGYCNDCSAAIKRMLVFKSYIRDEWPKAKRLSRFIDDYAAHPNLPYALRGCEPREEVIRRANRLLDAVVALEAFYKQQRDGR